MPNYKILNWLRTLILVLKLSEGNLQTEWKIAEIYIIALSVTRMVGSYTYMCVSIKIAANGGYMTACVANKIVAAPFSIIGSIGGEIPNFHWFV